MAINSALRKIGRPSLGRQAPPAEPLAVGEVEDSVFNCPNCARPLAQGANQCPGCGTHLIVGVKAKLALGFVVVGVAAGMVLGGGAMLVVGGRPSVASGEVTGAGAASANGGTAAGASASARLPADLGIPSQAVSGLRQASVINGRLSGYAADLDGALASKSTKGIVIARLLRSVSSDVMFGIAVAPTIAPWPAAADLSGDLGSFYAKVRDTAQAGLKTSVSDSSAYRLAGKRMAALLKKVATLEARANELVTDTGLAPLAP
ncbi:MAG TPA: zinc ribbon domain-containing protein [Candidatus Saccharimonadia bacterium]|nr:zinc ribbon domain-containing protein [Candidatus Saccharimonadia bacterium]